MTKYIGTPPRIFGPLHSPRLMASHPSRIITPSRGYNELLTSSRETNELVLIRMSRIASYPLRLASEKEARMSLRSKISHLLPPYREAELSALKVIAKRLTQQNDQLAKQHSEMLRVLNSLSSDSKKLRDVSENIRAAVMAPVQQRVFNLLQSKQLGFLESVRAISQERKSLARFGDGEFRLMYRSEFSIKFHRNSPALMESLREVLTNPSDDTLVGMPHAFFGTHWSTVYAEVWNFVEPLASNLDRCVNSHITRPIFFELHGREAVSAWRSVWETGMQP